MATTPNYDIDYNDKRFTDVKDAEQNTLTQSGQTYDEMIGNVDSQYQGLQDAVQQNADKMAQLQQENTDFAIEKIEQQKEQAQKDYTKEQSGAYVDWQKQSNQYGAKAEQMASQGLAGSGYSESAKVSMYNTYQNRVAIARESLNNVMLNYNNNIKEAILQNNSALAQIYSEASIRQQEIALEGFEYKNSLVLEKANKELEIKQFYSNEYQNVLNQMNTENALAESVRQFNEDQALKREELAQAQARWEEEQRVKQEQWQKEYDLAKTEAERKALLEEREMLLAENEYNAKYGANGTETVQARATQLAIDKEIQGNNNNGGVPSGYKSANMTAKTLPSSVLKAYGLDGNETIYTSNNKYYAVGSDGVAVEITKDFTFSNGYQPKYLNGYALSSVGTISDVGLSGNSVVSFLSSDKQGTQKVWKAGADYYVWNGKTKSYVKVTSAYKTAQEKKKKSTTLEESVKQGMITAGYDRYLY